MYYLLAIIVILIISFVIVSHSNEKEKNRLNEIHKLTRIYKELLCEYTEVTTQSQQDVAKSLATTNGYGEEWVRFMNINYDEPSRDGYLISKSYDSFSEKLFNAHS